MSPQFLVADMNRSIEFYTKKLGFDLDFRYEEFYAGIIKEGYSIHLKTKKPSTELKVGRESNEDLDIIFSVTGIERLYEDLSKKSIEFVQSLRYMPYGKEFYIVDPDWHIIAFVEEI